MLELELWGDPAPNNEDETMTIDKLIGDASELACWVAGYGDVDEGEAEQMAVRFVAYLAATELQEACYSTRDFMDEILTGSLPSMTDVSDALDWLAYSSYGDESESSSERMTWLLTDLQNFFGD